MKKNNSSLVKKIKDAMISAGIYGQELDLQIEIAAADIEIYRKLVEAVGTSDLILEEGSREGDVRVKVNPILKAVMQCSDQVRKDLKSLQLNRELKPLVTTQPEEDPLDEFMK